MRASAFRWLVVAVLLSPHPGTGAAPEDPSRRDAPPRALDHLQATAEGLVRAAGTANWLRVEWLLEEAGGDLETLEDQLGPERLVGTRRALQAARAAPAARELLATQRAAQAVTREAVELHAALRTDVSLDLLRLGVLLRQVQLETSAGQLDRARAAYRDVRPVWSRARGTLPVSADGVARAFEDWIARLGSALERGEVNVTTSATLQALFRLDQLEALDREGAGAGPLRSQGPAPP